MREPRWQIGLGAALLTACIIPDRGIDVEGAFENRGAVRIIEPTPLTEEADLACVEEAGGVGCPQPPPGAPHFMDPNDPEFVFCTCNIEDQEVDTNALKNFIIYAEDPDRDSNNNPEDPIFGAFLLDLPSDPRENIVVQNHRAYLRYWDPNRPAPQSGVQLEPPGQPEVLVREFEITDGVTPFVDLCDNDGTPVNTSQPEESSPVCTDFHTVTFLVTDRPWFAPVKTTGDTDGEVVIGPDGEPEKGPAQPGVPDQAASATAHSTSYTFCCRPRIDTVCDDNCQAPEG